jgi:hypothetical protein
MFVNSRVRITLTRTMPLFLAAGFLVVKSAESSIIPPQDLEANEPYHLVFITSIHTTTRSRDVNYYNDFVTSLANAAGIASLARIVGSTRGGVSAYDNTSSIFADHSSVPIYNPLGERVADSFTDLWDGSLYNAIKADELGNDLGNRGVATGTSWNGSTSWNPLGPKLPSYGVETGRAGATSGAWLSTAGLSPSKTSVPVYGITAELRTAAVPLPGSVFLLLPGLVGIVLFWKRVIGKDSGRGVRALSPRLQI